MAMIRLAWIGGSVQAASDCAQALARLRDACMKAVVHHEENTRRDLCQVFGISRSAASWDELIKAHSAEFDAALIYGSLDERADTARHAAAAGKHVFLISPMARSAPEAEEIVAACRSAGVRLMIGETARFRPSIAAVKLALDSRKLGDPALLRVHSWEPRRTGANEASPTPAQLSGDVIWSRTVQQLDLTVWMFRGLPTEIFVLGRNAESDAAPTPEYLQIHLGFPNGGMALISLAQALPAGDGYDSLSLVGSTGAAYADDQYQTQVVYRGGTPAALKTGEGIMAVTSQLREFIDAIAANREPSVTGADGKVALQLTEAARRSWVDRRPVRLEGGLDASRA